MGIKKPPSYEHPAKRARGGQARKSLTPAQVEAGQSPVKKKEAVRQPQVRLSSTSPTPSDKMVRLRVVAYDPNPGELTRYDDMIGSGIATKAALLGLLRSARPQLEVLLTRKSKELDALTFEHGQTCVETNWTISSETAEALKLLFDPFDILTPRSLGAKIGAAIIALNERSRVHG